MLLALRLVTREAWAADMETVKIAVERAASQARLTEENAYLRQELQSRHQFGSLIGSSPRVQEVYRLIEKAAREMKLDPAELRRRNFIRPGDFPYRTHLGDTYDGGDFARMLEGALQAADWQGFTKRKEESKRRGQLRGRGIAVYLEWTGALPTETVDIEVGADGTVTAFSGTQAMGQGLETSYTQLVVEQLGISLEHITDRLLEEGLQLFRESFDKVLAAVEQRPDIGMEGPEWTKQSAAEPAGAAGTVYLAGY